VIKRLTGSDIYILQLTRKPERCGVKAIVWLAGAQLGLSILWGPKSVCSGNGRLLILLHCLLPVLVSTSLYIINRCCSGFPVSGGTPVYKCLNI